MLFYEYLEEAINTSNIHESIQKTNYDYWISKHNALSSFRMNNNFYNECMNVLFPPASYHISILDGGADTCVLGEGWGVVSDIP
jgi:hypothetical protein